VFDIFYQRPWQELMAALVDPFVMELLDYRVVIFKTKVLQSGDTKAV
jgi:hypothetical protein